MIIKAYVTLLFVTNIDDLVAGTFPEEVFNNAELLNESKSLKVGKDENTSQKVW